MVLMVTLTLTLAVWALVMGSSHQELDFDRYKVVRVWLNGTGYQDTHEMLREVVSTRDLDVWTHSSKFVDVRVPRDAVISVEHEVMIDDINSAIRDTMPTTEGKFMLDQIVFGQDEGFGADGLVGAESLFFDSFRTLDEIYNWMDRLQESFSDIVTVEVVGKTYEGRELRALHLCANKQDTNPEKKTIVITGGLHAREWISVSSACWAVAQLVGRYALGDSKETKYLEGLDFLVIPVFNPDGYEYTFTNNRLWRKNRQQTYLPVCQGIDIDHSFGYQWEANHVYPCSEEYSGEAPFEAMEARSWNEYLSNVKGEYNIYGYLDLHSYSQEILYPYAYSCDAVPRDLENLLELAYGLNKAVRTQSGHNYDVVAACKDRGADLMPELGAGSALDFMYHQRAHWAFQFKLRDTGNHGFLLPPRFIRPVGKETYAALNYFCDFLLDPEI
ncbi:Inactive metallocarboxypeptidase ECM14 [Nakaseomyces bracarensis]|uniref:Inactive metallocarboxypeptidase ECM14 n=1 Tax=Nakaseomyces bracarensis TaxID=273131 RepID=A0ABR4NN53_9SACH